MSKEQFIAENIKEGELYAGLILGKDGARDYHLFLRPDELESATWDRAMEWAAEKGATTLPTRREQALLFANLMEQFQPRWYWSGEQCGHSSSNAWGQHFNDGDQVDTHKSCEGRARAVRRLEI